MTRNDIFNYTKETYKTEPEYPFKNDPITAILRNPKGKWYGVIMSIKSEWLGIKAGKRYDVLNLKCDPLLIGPLREKQGYFPAYHMNKEKWISVLLDNNADTNEVKFLINMSYSLTNN